MDDFFIFFHWTGTSFAVEALVGFVLRLVSANANYVKQFSHMNFSTGETQWEKIRGCANEAVK